MVSADGRHIIAGSWNGTVAIWDLISGSLENKFHVGAGGVHSIAITPNGRYVVTGSGDGTVHVWELDWDLEFQDQKDWDESARPLLASFLTARAVRQSEDRPSWNAEDFDEFNERLKDAGYGWLRPAGVLSELERMAETWAGPLGRTDRRKRRR